MKSYIPFTAARRERLFLTILNKWVGDKDGLANVEWPDGTKSLEPVEVDTDNSALVDENDNRWFFRGLGGESCNWNGIPVWDVYAGNAGVISTEAALIADAEEYGDRVVDVGAGEELPDDLVAEGLVDPNGQRGPADAWETEPVDREVVDLARSIERGELEAARPNELRSLAEAVARADDEGLDGSLSERVAGLFGGASSDEVLEDITVDSAELSADDIDDNGHARADGGVAQAPSARQPTPAADHDIPAPSELPDDAAVYDLRPPDGYDGVAISVRSPDYYDPFPVTRGDAKDAAEWAQRAGEQGKDKWMAGFIVGLLVFGVLWLLMTVVPWLLGEISTGSGGAGETLPGLLFLATPAVDGLRERLSAVVERLDSRGE
jgi:hypothetical protein